MKNDSISSGTLFALLYVSLFVGALVGNWIPITNSGGTISIRVLEMALVFLVVSAVMTWLASRPKGISTVRELDAAFKQPEAQRELADALHEHRQNIGA